MVDFKQHKKLIEQTFIHTCDIYEFAPQFDEKTKRTITKEILKYENISCKLSQSVSETGLDKTVSQDEYNKISRHIKLFIGTDIDIKAGSKIIVNYNNVVEIFKNASVPAVYQTHQEIVLESFKERA